MLKTIFFSAVFLCLSACASIKTAVGSMVDPTTCRPAQDPIADLIEKNEAVRKPENLSEAAIESAANMHGVPVELALAIAKTESGAALNPRKRGSIGERGLFQLRCSDNPKVVETAGWLGFRGRCDELYDPVVNAYWGTLHIRIALDKTGGDWCYASTLHNHGLWARPRESRYCRVVMRTLLQDIYGMESAGAA